MKDSPGWIESLFNSGIGLNCFEGTHALFRQDWSKSQVLAILSDDANRRRHCVRRRSKGCRVMMNERWSVHFCI